MGCICRSAEHEKYELEMEAVSPDITTSPPSSEPASIALSDGHEEEEFGNPTEITPKTSLVTDPRDTRAISYVSTASSVSGVHSTTIQRMTAASVVLPPAPGIAKLGQVMETDAEDVSYMDTDQSSNLLHQMAKDHSFGTVSDPPIYGISDAETEQSNLTKALKAIAGDDE